MSRRRRLLFLSVPYVAFILALLLVEAGTRLLLPRVTMLEAWIDAPQQQAGFIDREKVTIFEGDPLLFWRLKPNLDRAIWDFTVVSTNAQGLRHDGPIGRKEPGTFRIVCLGDSVTFGYRVPVVWPERPQDYNAEWLPYPMLLEKSLRAANPNRRVEVVALAVPGYSSHQGLAWLRRDIDALEPDLVTVCFGWNDIGMRPRPDSETLTTAWTHVTFRRLMSYSQALTHAALWMRRRSGDSAKAGPPVTAEVPRVPPQQYVRNILEMNELAKSRGARVLIIGPVYRDRQANPQEGNLIAHYRESLRAGAQEAGVPYLEIPELTEVNYPSNMGLFGEAIHPNHLGHRLMATALLKFFAAHKMLDDLNVPTEL